jgi:hypothetical protein
MLELYDANGPAARWPFWITRKVQKKQEPLFRFKTTVLYFVKIGIQDEIDENSKNPLQSVCAVQPGARDLFYALRDKFKQGL